jgi:hypothetical protein
LPALGRDVTPAHQDDDGTEDHEGSERDEQHQRLLVGVQPPEVCEDVRGEVHAQPM